MENNTEVIFENIEQRIIKEIKNAHYAIFVSVAWFTNKKLFNALLEKAQNNCYVSIIIQLDDINSQCGIDYSQIQIGRSECFMISKETELLHDKFCVIDFKKVITGSYNWTYKASHNSENILILNDPTVATQYIIRFEQQKKKYADFAIQTESNPKPSSNLTTRVKDENPVRSQNVENKSKIEPEPEIALKPKYTPPPKPKCPSCQKEKYEDEIFCSNCGYQLKGEKIGQSFVVICKQCLHIQEKSFVDATTRYCTFCGSSNLVFTKDGKNAKVAISNALGNSIH